MSSKPRAWLIRGQWGRWGGGGSGDRECPGAPPPSPLPILSMQMLFICVCKLNPGRRWPDSAISGSALLHFPGAQRPAAGMSQLENHRRSTGEVPLQFGVVTCLQGGATGVQSSQQESPPSDIKWNTWLLGNWMVIESQQLGNLPLAPLPMQGHHPPATITLEEQVSWSSARQDSRSSSGTAAGPTPAAAMQFTHGKTAIAAGGGAAAAAAAAAEAACVGIVEGGGDEARSIEPCWYGSSATTTIPPASDDGGSLSSSQVLQPAICTAAPLPTVEEASSGGHAAGVAATYGGLHAPSHARNVQQQAGQAPADGVSEQVGAGAEPAVMHLGTLFFGGEISR